MIRRLFSLLLCTQALLSCSEARTPLNIAFVPVFNGQALACGNAADIVQLTDLRFYVSDLQLVTADGGSVDITLEADGLWQQTDLALLDFEDGQGHCDNGTIEVNSFLRGYARGRDFTGLRFTIGVPFERNHADPLLATAPLGEGAMHWHWRAGYKFLRAGIRTADDSFWLHLGSTSCKGTVQHVSGCSSPNRVRVELNDFIPGKDVVEVNLAALVVQSRLEDGIATDCSSGPAETSCVAPFAALGLKHETGEATSSQQVFRKQVQY